ncbi:NADH dehydrogenase [ubiquinone] 1 alpha subcomplex subunit 2 [Periophthalmus magnuspinnatus]|nr:NADH dehydrogenase [ubiquinone] 1 alpha subcomplex subunit 2 [Periophthalmus magnuspinnatus]
MAASVVRTLGSSLAKNLREVRLHLSQSCAGSQGAREFVEQHYVTLKRSNPDFPILIRECSGVRATLWARYAHGRECSVSVENMSCDEVASALNGLAQNK